MYRRVGCQIMLVMPTRRFLPGTLHILGSCSIFVRSHASILVRIQLKWWRRGVPPHTHTTPHLTKHFYCFDIGTREPNCAVFQQNPVVVTAELDTTMDSDAMNSQAWTSIHLLGVFFSVCRDLVALRRNPIRSIASRDPICRKSRKINGFYQISRRRDTIEPNGEKQV